MHVSVADLNTCAARGPRPTMRARSRSGLIALHQRRPEGYGARLWTRDSEVVARMSAGHRGAMNRSTISTAARSIRARAMFDDAIQRQRVVGAHPMRTGARESATRVDSFLLEATLRGCGAPRVGPRVRVNARRNVGRAMLPASLLADFDLDALPSRGGTKLGTVRSELTPRERAGNTFPHASEDEDFRGGSGHAGLCVSFRRPPRPGRTRKECSARETRRSA